MAVRKFSTLLKYILFPVFIVTTVTIAYIFRENVAIFQSDVDDIREWLLDRHGWAFLIFIALQVLQVVIFVLPGEFIQIAGGYVFGITLASIYSYLGMLMGGTICAFVARYSGTSIIHRIIGNTRYKKMIDALSSKRAVGVFFILFFIPGFPKDVLYYVGGLSRVPFWFFISITSIARLPGIVGSSIIGVLIYTKNWAYIFIALGLMFVAVTLGIIFRKNINRWVDKSLAL